ncbi:hypothetical protein HK098_000928 [Nowakowskiella sp. JEL0407]|nr:hypothetical protein HK098_000928 [Nowakowskiella sp. JEL0407]
MNKENTIQRHTVYKPGHFRNASLFADSSSAGNSIDTAITLVKPSNTFPIQDSVKGSNNGNDKNEKRIRMLKILALVLGIIVISIVVLVIIIISFDKFNNSFTVQNNNGPESSTATVTNLDQYITIQANSPSTTTRTTFLTSQTVSTTLNVASSLQTSQTTTSSLPSPSSTPQPQSPSPSPSITGFSIKHVGSGKCLYPNNGSPNPDNNSPAVLFPACDSPLSKFTQTASGALLHISSGKCLHSRVANPDNDSDVEFYNACNDPFSQFQLVGSKLKHVASGKCVHVYLGGVNPADGMHLVFYNQCEVGSNRIDFVFA